MLSPLFNSGNTSFSFFEHEPTEDNDNEEVLWLRGRPVANQRSLSANGTNGSLAPVVRSQGTTDALDEHAVCYDRTPMQKLFHPVPNLDAMMDFVGVAHPRSAYGADDSDRGFTVDAMFRELT